MAETNDGGAGSREMLAGIALILATVLALIAANSPFAPAYEAWLNTRISLTIGTDHLGKPLILWVNDGMMAVFFLLVGLELKAEMLEGRLRRPSAVIMPGLAALGGMAVPAAIYLAATAGGAGLARGWAVPTATDIAFAMGVLALIGRGLPPALRAFLLTLAILDDLGAILVIALFYGHDLAPGWLAGALVPLCAMAVLARARMARVAPILALGAILWVMVLKSGIHATLAGVVTAFFIPMGDRKGGSPLHRLEHALQPYVAFMIVPLFAFANAGLPLSGITLGGEAGRIALGVGAGLVLGKFLGIAGAVWLVVRLARVPLPEGLGPRHIAGAAALAGIGFTMSLFIGGLAFGEGPEMNAVRLGVLAGSLVAAGLGFVLLRPLAKPAGLGAATPL